MTLCQESYYLCVFTSIDGKWQTDALNKDTNKEVNFEQCAYVAFPALSSLIRGKFYCPIQKVLKR